MKTTSLESDANSSMKLGSSYCVHKNFWYSQAWSLSQHHKNWRIIWGSHDIENRTAHEVTFETDCTRSCNRNRIFWGKICGLRAVHASSAFFPQAGHFPLSVHWTVHWWKFPRKLCGRKWLDCSARKFCNRNRKICSSSRKFFAVAGSRALESILVAGEMRHRVQSVWWGNTPEVSKQKNLNTNHNAVGDTVLFAGWVGLEAGVYVPFTGEVLKNVTWRKSWGKRYRWHNLAINKKKLKSKWSNRQRKKIMKVPFNDQNCWHLPSQLRGFAVVEGFPLYFRKNKRKRWTKIFITVFHIVSKNKSCNVPIAYFALVLLCCLLIYLYIHTTRKFLW